MTFIVQTANECDDWPDEAKAAFLEFEKACYQDNQDKPRTFAILCAVGALLHPKHGLAVHFSQSASNNSHLAQMCDDLAEMFRLAAKRFRQ